MATGAEHDLLLVRTRAALLDALDALEGHARSVVVVGAQAVFLVAGAVDVAIAATTKDSDVGLDPRELADDPLLEQAMTAGGFVPSTEPGQWLKDDVPVDLMVPASLLAQGPKKRSARIPPHALHAARATRGLEAALVDQDEMDVPALDDADPRVRRALVAGPSALIVAKVLKISERLNGPAHRLQNKDAHDLYRVLVAIDTVELVERFTRLLAVDVSEEVTREALDLLAELFAAGPDAAGPDMAGRAEEGVGDPEVVAASTAVLAADLLTALGHY